MFLEGKVKVMVEVSGFEVVLVMAATVEGSSIRSSAARAASRKSLVLSSSTRLTPAPTVTRAPRAKWAW